MLFLQSQHCCEGGEARRACRRVGTSPPPPNTKPVRANRKGSALARLHRARNATQLDMPTAARGKGARRTPTSQNAGATSIRGPAVPSKMKCLPLPKEAQQMERDGKRT
eukprot:626687-Pleurochrysis_carterae.AAC.2